MTKYIMKAGKDFVLSEMTQKTADILIENGKQTESKRFKDYPICIDNKYYFPRKEQNVKQASKEKEKTSNKKRP